MDNLFGFGGLGEIMLILLVALIFLGPERMIGFARTLGKWVNQIKTASDNISNQITREVEENKKALEEATGSLKSEVEEQRKAISGIANDFAKDVSGQMKSATAAAKEPLADVKSVKPPEAKPPQISPASEVPNNAATIPVTEKPTIPDTPG